MTEIYLGGILRNLTPDEITVLKTMRPRTAISEEILTTDLLWEPERVRNVIRSLAEKGLIDSVKS